MSLLTAPGVTMGNTHMVLQMNTNHILNKFPDEENQQATFSTLSGQRAFITAIDAFNPTAPQPGDYVDKTAILLEYPASVNNRPIPSQDDNYYYIMSGATAHQVDGQPFTFPIYRISDQPDTLVLQNADPSDTPNYQSIPLLSGLGLLMTNSFDLGILHHASGSSAQTYTFPLTLTFNTTAGLTTRKLTLTTANGQTESALGAPAANSGISSQSVFTDSNGNKQFRAITDSSGTRSQTDSGGNAVNLLMYETHIRATSLAAMTQPIDVTQARLMSIQIGQLNEATDAGLIVYSQAYAGQIDETLVNGQYSTTATNVAGSNLLQPKTPTYDPSATASLSQNDAYKVSLKSSANRRVDYRGVTMGVMMAMAAILPIIM